MKLLKETKNYLYDNSYFIDITPSHIHIYNFIKLKILTNTLILLEFANFQLTIKGQDLKIVKALKNEMMIKGILESINYIYE